MVNLFSRLNKPEDFSSRTVLTFKLDIHSPFMDCVFCYVIIVIKACQLVLNFVQTQRCTKLTLRNFHLNKQVGQSVNRKGMIMVKSKG